MGKLILKAKNMESVEAKIQEEVYTRESGKMVGIMGMAEKYNVTVATT